MGRRFVNPGRSARVGYAILSLELSLESAMGCVYWPKCPFKPVSKTATPGSIPGSPAQENAVRALAS